MRPAALKYLTGRGQATARRRFRLTVWRCVAWGPFAGGMPCNLLLIPIPMAYILGAVPALIGGLIYANWLHAQTRYQPDRIQCMVIGGLCGGLGVLLCLAPLWARQNGGPGLGSYLVASGILGGATVGAFETRRGQGIASDDAVSARDN